MSAHAEHGSWVIPPEALTEWLALAQILQESGPAPCETGDAGAWWPDRKAVSSPDTLGAIAGCSCCPAQDACLAYALAGGEREGVWGGTLPDERRTARAA